MPALAKAVVKPDENLYLVGHSMGCQTIARYLESLPAGVKIGGAVFVAGFFKHLTGLEDDPAVQETDQHWLTAPLDFDKVKSHLGKSVAIFSETDPYVPLDNQEDFENKLGSKIIVVKGPGHFSGGLDNCTELPEALNAVLEISK